MALATSGLLGSLKLSPAESAFRPWWDDLENYVVYTMIIVSILASPGGLFQYVTLECTPACPNNDEHCCFSWDYYEKKCLDPAFDRFYAKQFCSRTIGGRSYYDDSYYDLGARYFDTGIAIHGYVAYFQYILLACAAILVILDKPFVTFLFQTVNVEQVHKLIVLDDPYKTDDGKDWRETEAHTSRKIHEVISGLGSVGSYFASYLIRTILSIVVSVAIFLIMMFYYAQYLAGANPYYPCRVVSDLGSVLANCSGYATGLYEIIQWIFFVLLGIYFLLNLYNLTWILSSGHFSSLDGVMSKYKKKGVSACLKRLYYNNRNVKLLMCLLSSSSGLGAPLRALALVERALSDSLIPELQIVTMEQSQKGPSIYSLRVHIPTDSILEYVTKRKDCYVTFCIEIGNHVEHVTETCPNVEIKLNETEITQNTVRISVSLNGKIVAVKKIDGMSARYQGENMIIPIQKLE